MSATARKIAARKCTCGERRDEHTAALVALDGRAPCLKCSKCRDFVIAKATVTQKRSWKTQGSKF